MNVYKGKTKSVRGDKTYWNDTGHTLFVEEKNGQQVFGMIDARSPEVKVYFFALEKKQAGPASPSSGINEGFGDTGGDLPF